MNMIRSPSLSAVTNAVMHDVWAITPEMHARLQDIVLERLQGHRPDLAEIEARVAGQSYGSETPAQNGPQVAVVSLHGVLISRAGLMDRMSGATSPQAFASLVRQYADDSAISALVIDCDTPGGTVSGTQLAAEAVQYAAHRKRTIACINDMACSAGYWIASQATEVVTLSNATLGSIGVITTHFDFRGWYAKEGVKPTVVRSADLKALGQDSEPMTGKALEQTRVRLQAHHDEFVRAVATGRKVSVKKAGSWATGETWLGEQAVSLGLADRLGSINDVLAELLDSDPEEANSSPVAAAHIALNSQPSTVSSSPPPAATSAPPAAAEQNPSPTDDPPPTQEAGSSIPPSPAPHAQEDRMNIAAISVKLAAGDALTAEERRFLDDHLNAQTTGQPAAQVDTSALSPEVKSLLDQANARAEQAERTANTERDTRLNREFSEKAVALGQPATFGATLREASEKLSPEAYQALEQSLNATSAQDQLVAETGSSKDARQAASPQAEYERRVTAHLKDDPNTSRADAGRAVLAADPEFARRYRG